MSKTEFSNFEMKQDFQGIAFVQAPEQLLGGREALNLSQLISKLDSNEVKSFVIEVSSVNVMNSSGLGMLISAHRNLSQKDIKLYLLNPSKKVQDLVTITHLDKVFVFINNLSEI